MEDRLSALYHGIILEHNRAPQYFEKRPAAQFAVEAYNPVCGDKFTLYLDAEAGTIARATFHGYGCAVSKASTSVLMKKIQGLPFAAVQAVIATFFAETGSRNDPPVAQPDPEIAAFAPVKNFPGRLTCVTLSWQALSDFLKNEV